jgi:phospholipid/cholesterol/gamma-HCH transport system substrate-binding protein
MAQRLQRVRTVPGLGRDVAATLALMLIGVVCAVYLLAQVNVSAPWAKRSHLRVELADAVAVSPVNQQEVRIAGIKVGLITDVVPTDHNTAIVTAELEPGHTIFDNARAVLRPVNPLNQMYLTLNPGGPPGHPLPDGGLIPVSQTSRPIQADEVLDKLDQKARVALTSLLEESDNALATAPRSLPAALTSADTSLNLLKPVVDRLAVRHDNIEKLITGFSQLATGLGRNDARLTSLVNSTQATLGVLAQRDAELESTLQQLPGTTDTLRRALANTSDLSRQLNPTLDNLKTAAQDLPDALDEFHSALGPLRDTVDAARPVADRGRPFVSDLRRDVDNVRDTFQDLRPLTKCLDEDTAKIAPWMYDLGGFTYNTESIFGVRDTNGAFPRGHLTINMTSPLGAMHQFGDKEIHTNRYQDAPSATTGLRYPAKGSGECQ